MIINGFLKEYLKDMTQQDIEKATGISQSKISQIFNGKRKLTVEELIRIAIVYDIDLNEIKKETKPAWETCTWFQSLSLY